MKKFLAILFLSIFTIQILPIKEIGKILWNGQMTEEVHESGSCHKKMASDSHNKLWYHNFGTAISIEDNGVSRLTLHVLRDEALIKSHHRDVPLQPPNYC
jgi:hypothetical protein